jgi:hypothetical protein
MDQVDRMVSDRAGDILYLWEKEKQVKQLIDYR